MDFLLCEDVRKLISGHLKPENKKERFEPSSCKASLILNKSVEFLKSPTIIVPPVGKGGFKHSISPKFRKMFPLLE